MIEWARENPLFTLIIVFTLIGAVEEIVKRSLRHHRQLRRDAEREERD